MVDDGLTCVALSSGVAPSIRAWFQAWCLAGRATVPRATVGGRIIEPELSPSSPCRGPGRRSPNDINCAYRV
jgi:hypothetical protein